MEIYTTKEGNKLLVGRVDRRKIDKNLGVIPEPIPPTRELEVFGGILEEQPILDDPTYLNELQEYYLILYNDYIDVLLEGVQVADGIESIEDYGELKEVLKSDNSILLSLFKDEDDINNIIGRIMYLSTVTPEAILEATKKFDVRFLDKAVGDWKTPSIPATYSPLFRDKLIAKDFGYTWPEFCALTGYEQSELVAISQLQGSLDYIIQRWQQK